MSGPEQENLITRKNYDNRLLNYAGRLSGLVGTALFAACGFEWLQITQHLDPFFITQVSRFAVFDIFVGGFFASASKVALGDKPKLNFEVGYVPISLYEFTEQFGTPGIYSPWHIPAYMAGALIWTVYDRLPKSIYHSGLTKPIYQILKIQDQRNP